MNKKSRLNRADEHDFDFYDFDNLRETHTEKRSSDSQINGKGESVFSPVQSYMKDMGNILLLSREEEVCLARQMEKGERIIQNVLIQTDEYIGELESIAESLKTHPPLIHQYFNTTVSAGDERKITQESKRLQNRIEQIRDIYANIQEIPDTKKNLYSRGREFIRLKGMVQELKLQDHVMESKLDVIWERLSAQQKQTKAKSKKRKPRS